jgi:acyl-CoA dehydrogenase
LLAEAGIPVPEGPISVLPEPVDAAAIRGNTLTLVAHAVPWARVAPHLVFTTVGREGMQVGVATTLAAVETSHAENIAREPRDTVRFDRASVEALRPAHLPTDVVRLYGAMVRSAQMAGAMEALLVQAVQYAGERVQFGRPISKFQVIQQELAKLAGDVAASGVAAEAAFYAAARSATSAGASVDPRFEIAVAKTRVGDSVPQATGIAHQVHGAIGFTYEHGLHFATRRLWAWRAEFGTDAYWAAELGRAAVTRGAELLWPYLTSRSHATS